MEAALINLVPEYLPALARVGAILMFAPMVSSPAVPVRVRVLLAMALTLGLMPAVGTAAAVDSLGAMLVGICGEIVIGIAIGMAISLVFVAARMAGEIIAQQLGLSVAEMFDPQAGGEANVLSSAYSLLAVVVFLGVNGHHALINGIGASFSALPVMSAFNSANVVTMLSGLLLGAMTLALQIAMPVFVTMLIVDLVVGMIGRTVPQVGMMTIGISLRAIVGFVLLALSMAMTATLLQGATVGWMQLVKAAMGSLLGN